MRDFKKYDVWQISKEFCLLAYAYTKRFPKDELYGLTSQLRRAALSIPTNISEGCGRQGEKEFAAFLNIALGSAHEVENLVIIATELSYFTTDEFHLLDAKINLIKQKLYHLHKVLITKK